MISIAYASAIFLGLMVIDATISLITKEFCDRNGIIKVYSSSIISIFIMVITIITLIMKSPSNWNAILVAAPALLAGWINMKIVDRYDCSKLIDTANTIKLEKVNGKEFMLNYLYINGEKIFARFTINDNLGDVEPIRRVDETTKYIIPKKGQIVVDCASKSKFPEIDEIMIREIIGVKTGQAFLIDIYKSGEYKDVADSLENICYGMLIRKIKDEMV